LLCDCDGGAGAGVLMNRALKRERHAMPQLLPTCYLRAFASAQPGKPPRPILISSLGRTRGEVAPPAPGVKLTPKGEDNQSVRPYVLLNSRVCSSLGVKRGVCSPLGAKAHLWDQVYPLGPNVTKGRTHIAKLGSQSLLPAKRCLGLGLILLRYLMCWMFFFLRGSVITFPVFWRQEAALHTNTRFFVIISPPYHQNTHAYILQFRHSRPKPELPRLILGYARRSMFEKRRLFSADLHPILCCKERFC
jgi:hypothetical protein